MTARARRLLILSLIAASVWGCEAVKSANPLSPSVAGPIPGVVISEPKLLEPGSGWELDNATQPIRLLVENASTNGQRPLSYTFQLASDAQFTNLVFARGGVAPGDGGRTSIQMTDRLPTGRSFFWRARAEDGANTGPYSAAVSFSIITPVVIDVPTPVEPVGGATISSTKPSFKIRNPSVSGPAGQIVLIVHVANDEAFGSLVAIYSVPAQGTETHFAPALELPYDRTFFWRVRAYDSGPSGVNSAWSATQAFRTPAVPPPPPAPPPDGGGGGGGSWENCGSTPGVTLVACVRAAVNPSLTSEGAFEVTKRVAWLLRGGGAGLLIKNSGENVVQWKGYNFSASRILYSDLHLFKVISDAGPGGANAAAWQDEGIDPSLAGRYVPAIDPR